MASNELLDIDPDEHFFSRSDCHYYNYDNFPSIEFSRDDMSLFHANMRSMTKNSQELLNCLEIIKVPMSVIALSETWLSESSESFNTIPNYQTVSASRCNRVGGGVSLHIHNSLKFKRCPGIGIFNDCIESLFIEITTPNSQNNILIGVVYRPFGHSVQDFMVLMSEILNKIPTHKICYILGDFNVDLNDYHSNPLSSEFYELMSSHAFLPLINKSTRISSTRSSLIDNIFSNSLDLEHMSGVIQTDISDHFPVFTISKLNFLIKSDSHITFRSYTDNNTNRFIELIRQENWSPSHTQTNPQNAFTEFCNKLKAVHDLAFPVKERKPTKKILING